MNTHQETENAEAEAIGKWLEGRGYSVIRRYVAAGIEIDARHARHGGWRIALAGSRHGTHFAEDPLLQVTTGFFLAATIGGGADGDGARTSLAVSRSTAAEHHVATLRLALTRLGISVLWIEPSGGVTAEEPAVAADDGRRPEDLNASNDD